MTGQAPISIESLRASVRAISQRQRPEDRPQAARSVTAAWGPLARSALHEWLADAPPQTLLSDLARRAMTPGGCVFWIGRACRPYAASLGAADDTAGRGTMLDRCVFVDVPAKRRAARVWAIDLVLRCGACAAVIADGRDLDIAQSRRLQLAAEAGRALAMLWRRADEVRALSVAHYRWRVTPVATDAAHPRWRIERLRCKDTVSQHDTGIQDTLLVEHRGAQGLVVIPPGVVDRSRPATGAFAAARRTA